MPNYATIFPTGLTDGIPYATSKIVPAVESDLFNQPVPPFEFPVPVRYGDALCAVIILTPSGLLATNLTYVVLQTDLFSDGNFVDVAGLRWTDTSGAKGIFTMSAGMDGALCVQFTRAVGTAPATVGANQMTLGGRIRFIGKTTLTASSSSSSSSGSPGGPLQVTANITYKLMGRR